MFFLSRGRKGPPPPVSMPPSPTTWTVHCTTMVLPATEAFSKPRTSSAWTEAFSKPKTSPAPAAPTSLPDPARHPPCASAPMEAFSKPRTTLAPAAGTASSPPKTSPAPAAATASSSPTSLPDPARHPPCASAPMEAFSKPRSAMAPTTSPAPARHPLPASDRGKMLNETGATAATALHLPPRLPRPARLGLGAVWTKTTIRANDALVDTHLYRHDMKYHDFSREKNCAPSVGRWSMINEGMINAGTIDNWTCLNLSSVSTKEAKKFCKGVTHVCNDTGMVISANPCVEVTSIASKHIENAIRDVQCRANQKLEQHGNGNQLQLLIVILPETAGSFEKVKSLCVSDSEVGILYQFCWPKHASCPSKQYLMDVALEINSKFGEYKAFLQRALACNGPFVSEAPTTFTGADVAHGLPAGGIQSPVASVTVCICDYKIELPILVGTITVLDFVLSALVKLNIRACDFYLRLNGRTLDRNLKVNSIPDLKGSKILIVPRMRGGAFVWNSLRYEQLDVIINLNHNALFNEVQIPQGMRDPSKNKRALFLAELPRYILHQLLVLVCCEGHLRKRCYYGQFNLSNIMMSRCGHMRLDSSVRSYQYTDEGAEADYQQLYDIVFTFVDVKGGRYPLHVNNLLWVLRNAPDPLRKEATFVAFLVNHPCLLTYAEREMLYILVQEFIYKLLSSITTSASPSATTSAPPSASTTSAPASATTSASPSADVIALNACLSSVGQGWNTIVNNNAISEFYQTYIRDAQLSPQGILVSKYQPGLDHGFRLGRNYLSHTKPQVTLQEAEASLSYLLEFMLPEVLYHCSRLLTGQNAKDFIHLVSNPRANRTTVYPHCRWNVPGDADPVPHHPGLGAHGH